MNNPNSPGFSGKLFGFEIRYNNPTSNANYTTPKYNGNISEFEWYGVKGNMLKRYAYQYDQLNRLNNAIYLEPTATLPVVNAFGESMTYDSNGNIQTLKRYRANGNTPLLIDDLNYETYRGNQLLKVVDNSNNTSGYAGGGNAIDYDRNGNMINHLDHKIKNISYNYLNLPLKVEFTDNTSSLNFIYRADGVKLQKAYTYLNSRSGIWLTEFMDYLDGFQYIDQSGFRSLEFVPTSEGYYDFRNKRYVYNYTDHIGNVRSAYFRGTNNEATLDRETNYYPFGLEHPGATAGTKSPNYNYGFQGQEKQKETGWSSFKWRNAIPELGRFFNVDPLSEKYAYQSHYNFSENWVTSHRELEGLEAIDAKKIREVFNNGKQGKSYQLVIHIDQPGKGGDRNTYEYNKGPDPGHAFITLNRKNTDGTTDSKTFGFYPYPQSVNPLASEADGKIRDNFGHEQEVVQTRPITEKNFNNILDFVESEKNTKYDLNTNNCTDFVINAAAAANIKLPRTKGTWPNGGGSNPGDFGEDLREQNKNIRKGKSPEGTSRNENKNKENDKKISL